MQLPLGFEHSTISTRLGDMACAIPQEKLWRTEGKSKTPLVFLHGFGGGSSSYEWSKVYPAFANDYPVFAPDLLGWGSSERPQKDYCIEDYVSSLTDFLEQTCTQPAIVVASSLTAAFVIRIAVSRPELFQSLILVSPAGLSDFGKDYSQSFFAQLVSTPILDRMVYHTGIANEIAIRAFLEQRQFADTECITNEMVQSYLRSAQQPNAEYSALSFVRGDLSFDLSPYIVELTTPTSLLWGEQSQFTGPDLGRRFAELNPNAIKIFQILEGVGLTPQLEQPAVTTGLIRQYIHTLQTPSG